MKKYYKIWKDPKAVAFEITREEALATVAKCYNNPEEVLGDLREGDFLNCMFSYIQVKDKK